MPPDIIDIEDARTRADPELVVERLGKAFRRRPVVRNVSFSIARGEALGLVGPNGAGKTTIFYMITGMIQPDTGMVRLGAQSLNRLPMYKRARLGINYLPQEASIFRGLTVEGNLRAVLEVCEAEHDRRETRLEELLNEFAIEHLRHTPATALSGGERRRVEIARALAGHPAFMLLDEPFAGIDPIAVGEMRDLVARLKGKGVGLLITDHNVRETLDIVDRAVVIHDGRVLVEDRPDHIVGDAEVRKLYLGNRFSWKN